MYERGGQEPGFETMEAIADLFNVVYEIICTDVQILRY